MERVVFSSFIKINQNGILFKHSPPKLSLALCGVINGNFMGWDTRLILKGDKTKEQLKGVETPSIYCDRGCNLVNELTEHLGVSGKLQSDGLTKNELCDILEIIIDIRGEPSMADEILDGLKKYNGTDVFILVDWDYCL